MKIGILGGTFDPPHNGHLAIADAAVEKPGLKKIIFIPSHRTPMKDRPDISAPDHRWKMLEAAIEGKAGFEVSDIELYRPGPSYTIDTLKILKARFKPTDGLFFIMGWDSLNELPSWKQAPELVKLCTIVAFTRPNSLRPDMKKLEKQIPGLEGRYILLDIPPVDISSTEIREMVKLGKSIKGLVPAAVEKYIREHHLYSKPGEMGAVEPADTILIAPCGMNCRVCMAYVREKNVCPGCRADDTFKSKSCVRCIIKNCEHIRTGKTGFCYDCGKFPCLRLKQLDKRYRAKYGMSMLENLEYIKRSGIKAFVDQENKRWVCPNCGATLCVHRESCTACGHKWHDAGAVL